MNKGRDPVYTRLSVRNRDLCITNLQTFVHVLGTSAWNKGGIVQILWYT